MPSLIQDLIAQAAGAPQSPKGITPVAEAKRQSIEAASLRKKEALGVGVDSAYNIALSGDQQDGILGRSERENDLRDMPVNELYQKYGDQANDMMLQRSAGARAVAADQGQLDRDIGDRTADGAKTFGSAVMQSAGGLAAWGLSAATPDAESGIPTNMLELLGAAANKGADLGAMATGQEPIKGGATSFVGVKLAQLLGDAAKGIRSTQSDELNTLRGVQEAATELTNRDSDVIYQSDIKAGKSELVAGMGKVGREALDSIDTATDNSAITADGTVAALGSLAVSITTGGVLRSAATKTLGTVGKLAKIGQTAAAGGSIGLVEGGGAYTGAVNEVMNRSPEELMATSSDFRALVESGLDPLTAQRQLADDAGQKTAANVAPVAALIGAAVSPLSGGTAANALRQAPSSLFREPVEEGLQGGTGQLIQNAVIKQDVDAQQGLTEGVGRQAGEGALYGLGMSGTLAAAKTPALAVKGAATIAKAGANSVGKVLDARTATVQAQNDLNSPVADHKVAAQAEAMEVNRPVAEATVAESIDKMEAAPEVKAKATEYTQGVLVASTFDPTTYTEDPRAAPELHAALEGVTSRVKAIQIMANIVNNAEDGSDLQMGTASLMYDSFKPIEEAIDSDASALAALPDGDATRAIIDEYESTMQGVQQSPAVINAIGKVVQYRAALKAEELTTETLATGKGQLQAMATVDEAIATHDKGDLNTNEAILYQAAQGNLKLTAKQKESLSASVALLRAVRDANEQAKLNGEANEVSLNITTEAGAKGESILGHTNNVRDAMRGGDKVKAAEDLTTLGNFATSMSNKMQALADSMTSLKPQTYQTVRNGKWFESSAPVIVHQQTLGSVRFAQRVYREARLAVDVFNGLSDAYPALGMVKMPMPALPAALNMAAQAVVNNFAGVKAPTTPVVKASAPTVTPTPVDTTVEDEAAAQLDQDRADQAAYEASLSTPAPAVVKAKAPTTVPAPAPVAQENTTGIDDELLAELEAKAEDRGREVEEEFVEPTDGKGLSALFDQLIGGAKNLFLTSFKLPKEATTHIIGSETPLADVTKALSSESAKTAFTGKNGSRKLTDEAAAEYSKMLGLLPGVIDTLNANLAAFVTKNGAAIKAGKAFNWYNSKLMNIVELVDGKYQYNQALLESAVLGGLHWALNVHGQDTLEMSDLAQITGQDITSLDPTLLNDYGKGVGMAEAIRSMGMTISKFWGVRAESDAYRGRTEGIPQSMASEILGALEEAGFLHIVNLTAGVGETTRDHFRVVPVNLPEGSALAENSTAIEEVVMVTPEVVFHIGTPPTESSTHQLRRGNVKLTEQQVQAQAEAQNTKHFLDLPMVALYKALGMERVRSVWGSGVSDTSVMNINHAKSLEGKDRAAISAYRTMMNLVEQVGQAASEAGVALNKMPVHFNYDFTSVNRLQMRGANSPTANKFVREGLLPTNSVLDLSQDNSTDMNNFKLAIGQALGVKVHRFSLADTVSKVDALLTGSLKPTIDALSQWAATSYDEADPLATEEMSDSLFEMIQRDFRVAGVPLSAVALHAVLDYARLQAAADKSAFKTNLYVEADGVSNGPINAMMLFFSGQFNATWIKNVSRGGISLGNRKTLAEIYDQKGFKDLYEVTADDSKSELNKLARKLGKTNPAVHQQLLNLLTLMDMTLGKDMSFDDQGNITINRGLTKNPLTITIYGSGAGGIASKLVSTMVESLYEKMSAGAIGTGDINMDIFGDQAATPEHAAKMMDDFLTAWEALTDNTVTFSYMDFTYDLEHNPANAKQGTRDPRTFTANPTQLANLSSAMTLLFVAPMKKAITANVGKEVFETTTVIQKATQVQSIVLAHFFKVGVQKKIAEKKARAAEQVARGEEPDWKPTDFLKPSEEAEIHESIRHMAPMIKTDTQSWYVAGAERNDVANVKFGSSLNGKRTVDASVYAPADAGVSGVPLMNIGAGDAQGIQNVLTEPDVSSKILTIYDGIHLALDELASMGRLVNKAIFDTWKNNPMQAVSDTFAAFVEDTDLEDMEHGLLSDVLAVFLAENEVPEDPQATALLAIKSLAKQAADHANMIQARINTLARVNMSADQMAATGEAYNTDGLIDLSGLEPEQQANELNVLLQEELIKLRADKPKTDLTASIAAQGTKHVSGARVLQTADLKQLHASVNLPKDQQDVFRRIMARMAVDGFKVVYGTALQLAQYQLDTQGKSLTHSTGEIAGYTDVANKTVFLISPSSETLVHELIHAGTFAKVLQHYITKGRGNAEVAGAVTRLEALMRQFLGLQEEALTLSEDARIAYLNARDAIRGHLADDTPGGKAAGLNEFMAWAGSNASLIRLGKRTKATKLGRIAEAALQAIKSMFGIGVEGKDLFSNLVFNTEIIMAAAAPLSTRVGEVTLYQSSTYGNNERLIGVAKTFNHYVAQYLASPVTLGKLEPASSRDNAIVLAKDVMDVFEAARFFGTEQERTTFKAISIALSTEAQFDGNVMAVAQKMYAHVVKNLTVEHFMPEVTNNQDRDYYYALQKFNAIVGKHSIGNDTLNRSTLMPSFLALATVNDEFRAILAGMELPKTALKGWNTLDGILENAGNMGMESLATRLSGVGANSTNVQLAIDSLNQQLTDLAVEQESRFDQMQQQGGGYIDQGNKWVVDRTGSMAKALLARSQAINEKTTSKVVKQVTNFGMGIAGILSDETGQQVSEAVLMSTNNVEMWSGFRDLIGDLVGRTVTNKNVYDMIKRVRSGIQNLRQQYREHLPTLLAKKFSRVLTKEEWASAYNGVAKTDIAALVGNGFNMVDLMGMLADDKKMAKAVSKLEADLQAADPDNFSELQQKMDQLAHYMSTGEVGNGLLRNATAIARFSGDRKSVGYKARTPSFTRQIDLLVSMYAYENQSKEDKAVMAQLVKDEKDGLAFVVDYMVGQRKAELGKQASGVGHLNHYKGFIGSASEAGSMIVADDSDFSKLAAKSYTRVGDYKGSVMEGKSRRGYYYSPAAARAGFEQGIFQNVRHTVSGVDSLTGFSVGGTAGVITDPVRVARITKNLALDTRGEQLMPLFDANGAVYAYERSLNPTEMARIAAPNHLAKAIGQWRGRQVEEAGAQAVNEELLGHLKDMHNADVAKGKVYADQYVDLNKTDKLDPVIKDAVSLLNNQTRDSIKEIFGDEFMVRRELLNDVLGYRGASISDAWTGTTRWSPETQKAVYNLALGVFGNDAYKYLTNAESFIQSAVGDAKVLIVVKSVVVPMTNLIANVYQLIARGVPIRDILKGYKSKVMEIDSYAKSRLREIEVEAELRAATGNVIKTNKLNAELKSIVDGHRRLSIWPLIEAGEFSSVSDVGLTREEIMLTEGRLAQYIEAQVDKLPPGLATVGKNLLVTKDTALFQGLQRSVEYGDMIAKAILYDDLTTRGKKTQAEALGRITEEFVNYDRLPGRFRGAMENLGLLWFYNFKIRITKQAISMIRNNPLHTLLAMALPTPDMFGSVGLPVTDNLATKLLEDSLGGSIGPTQGLTAVNLNPWLNLVQ